jgi:hypothetical protein
MLYNAVYLHSSVLCVITFIYTVMFVHIYYFVLHAYVAVISQQSDVSKIQKWNTTFRKLNVSVLKYEVWKTQHIRVRYAIFPQSLCHCFPGISQPN